MNYRLKALQVSVAVHLLVIAALVGIGNFFEPAKKRIVIDFSIEDRALAPDISASNPQPEPVKEARRVVNTRPAERAPVPPVPEQPKAEQRPQEVPAVAPALSASQAPVAAAPVPKTVARVHQVTAEERPVQHVGSTTPGGRIAISDSSDARKRQYYSLVRELILKKAVYPRMAERLRLEGGVLVFFAVSQNGQLLEVRVTQSSGKELLDKSAVEAVRRSSPFPKPPVDSEVEMSIPIAYRLPA